MSHEQSFLSTHAALSEFGWMREDEELQVKWEVSENTEKAKASLEFILNGCKCKTICSTKRCSCRKTNRVCRPSCECLNCTNTTRKPSEIPSYASELETFQLITEEERKQDKYVDEIDDDGLEYFRLEQEVDEIMNFVFGDESEDEDEERKEIENEEENEEIL